MSERLAQLISSGREHYEAGQYAEAERLLAEAIAMRPSFPDVYNMLGVIYHAGGRFEEAEDAFDSALRLNPAYTEAALNLAVTLNDRGKYDRARAIYNSAVAATTGQPKNVDGFARGKLANMHAEIGRAYAGLGMLDEAARELSKALDLAPDFVDLRVALAKVYRDLKMHNAAIAEFEHAKRLRPEYAPARVHLGITLFSVGRKDEAVAEWKAVLERDPGNKSAGAYLKMVKDDRAPRAGTALEEDEG